jgi:hypothetical protein
MTLGEPGTKMDQNAGDLVMSRTRSISHAPDRRENSHPEPTPRGAWTLCRKFESFPVRDNAMLQSWTEQGRVRPDDYLVSLELDLCVQARDVAELAAIFQRGRARLLGKIWRAAACGALLLAWFSPLSGAAILLSVIAAAILCSRAAHRPQTCSFDSTDRRLCDLAPARSA